MWGTPLTDQPERFSGELDARRRQNNVQRLRWTVGALYTALIAYLALTALFPSIPDHAPNGLRWFALPGSWPTLVVVLAFPLAILLLGRAAGRPILASAPLLILAAMAVSAAILGMASFWRCHGDQSPFFAPLSWTLALFVGNLEPTYAGDPTAENICGRADLPVSLELARLLAISTTLSTAVFAALSLFHSQLDRIAIWHAKNLTVIVGIDDDTLPMVTAIARRMGSSETLAVITGNAARPCVTEARQLGARIREIPLTDSQTLTDLRLWRKLDRLYLLSEDPVQNEKRLRAIDTALDGLGVHRPRLPLTVRIDDPWHAEVWRRSFLESRDPSVFTRDGAHRWVADAVGKYECTANKIARHLLRNNQSRPAPQAVVLVGVHRLTYALTSELAQMTREQMFYSDPLRTLPARVIVMAPDASGFLTDHHLRQERIAPGETSLIVEPCDTRPSVEAIMQIVGTDEERYAVVLTDPSLEQFGTRLANRCTRMLVYQATEASATLSDSSTVGRLFPFPISMAIDEHAPQDAWERAAQLIHEAYRANSKAKGWSISEEVDHDWATLGPVYKQQNRRQVTHTLALVESVGHSWNTLDHPPAPPLPENFHDMSRAEKLDVLGFKPNTVGMMIADEHQSWMDLFEDHHWKYSEVRNDQKRLHNRLRPWQELIDEDREVLRLRAEQFTNGENPPKTVELHRDRAENSLIDTLLTLRSLGYRSMPKDTCV